jgi:hypothetical protein
MCAHTKSNTATTTIRARDLRDTPFEDGMTIRPPAGTTITIVSVKFVRYESVTIELSSGQEIVVSENGHCGDIELDMPGNWDVEEVG